MPSDGISGNLHVGDSSTNKRKRKRKNPRVTNRMMADTSAGVGAGKGVETSASNSATLRTLNSRNALSTKARSLMNLHNNEAGRRVSKSENKIVDFHEINLM